MATAAERVPVAKTYKIYIDGKFPRTESGRYFTLEDKKGVVIANICRGSRNDGTRIGDSDVPHTGRSREQGEQHAVWIVGRHLD